jgi:hypothetical protein
MNRVNVSELAPQMQNEATDLERVQRVTRPGVSL